MSPHPDTYASSYVRIGVAAGSELLSISYSCCYDIFDLATHGPNETGHYILMTTRRGYCSAGELVHGVYEFRTLLLAEVYYQLRSDTRTPQCNRISQIIAPFIIRQIGAVNSGQYAGPQMGYPYASMCGDLQDSKTKRSIQHGDHCFLLCCASTTFWASFRPCLSNCVTLVPTVHDASSHGPNRNYLGSSATTRC
jgi:hypothetical protein